MPTTYERLQKDYQDRGRRILKLEAKVAGMLDKWASPAEVAVLQSQISLLKNENERLTKLLEE